MSKYTDIRRQVVFKAVAGGSTTLTVGTTPIVGGTVGRIFFQGTGDVLAQSSNLFWDNTTSKLSLGGGTTPSSAILVQSSTGNTDALSLSLSFKRTNSANTNTTWSAVRSYNSADTLVGLFGTFQETAGGGSRFTVSTSTNTTSTAVTERFRVASDGKTSLGQSILGGAALDVHALGALSTDIAFRVRNSANTYNILQIQGDGNILYSLNNPPTFTLNNGLNIAGQQSDVFTSVVGSNTSGQANYGYLARGLASGNNISMFCDYGNKSGGGAGSSNIFYSSGSSSAYLNFGILGSNSNGIRFTANTGSTINSTEGKLFSISVSSVTWYQSVIGIGTYANASQSAKPSNSYGGNVLLIANGTAPTTTGTDASAIYSADIVAGNAAPHFRTEAGNIIKLYQETNAITAGTYASVGGSAVSSDDTFGGYSIGQIVAALKAQGLLA